MCEVPDVIINYFNREQWYMIERMSIWKGISSQQDEHEEGSVFEKDTYGQRGACTIWWICRRGCFYNMLNILKGVPPQHNKYFERGAFTTDQFSQGGAFTKDYCGQGGALTKD